ncbi:hypothetical protein KY362_06360 [Candidatus Woesearchaeota archaeon]|nr:hypothetical protein [Candidatus Woesearchaeota archaeon]
MFSAKSGDTIYYAGRIPGDPKSRDYTCIHCDEPMSHVRSTVRSGMHYVPEHFRHRPGAYINHPDRKFNVMRGQVVNYLLDQLVPNPELDVETDARIQTTSLDFIVDILVHDRNTRRDTAFISEPGPFRYEDLANQIRALSAESIPSMVVLSASGEHNNKGIYLKMERAKERRKENVAKLKPNELAINRLFGQNIYFDHDKDELLVASFIDYEEWHEAEEYDSGYRQEAGFRQFKTLKKVKEHGRFSTFDIAHFRRGTILLARPTEAEFRLMP